MTPEEIVKQAREVYAGPPCTELAYTLADMVPALCDAYDAEKRRADEAEAAKLAFAESIAPTIGHATIIAGKLGCGPEKTALEVIEVVDSLLAKLTAARKAIEDAPHRASCAAIEHEQRGNGFDEARCDCWKSTALATLSEP